MTNFLPTEQKRILRKEYIIRLCILWGFVIGISAFIFTLSMLPAYISVQAKQSETKIKLSSLKSPLSATTSPVFDELKKSDEFLKKFSSTIQNESIIYAIGIISRSSLPGIKINSFEFTGLEKGKIDMKVGGMASTRDDLLAFKKNLETDELTKKVELPVSDLAKSKNITFVLRLQAK